MKRTRSVHVGATGRLPLPILCGWTARPASTHLLVISDPDRLSLAVCWRECD
jgi:hypothetical protein